MPTLAFDVFGTLVNTGGIAVALTAHTDAPAAFAARWRDKQLEYAFRRTAMGAYVPFSECTRDALDFVCAEQGAEISVAARRVLMDEYRRLPPYPDAPPCLSAFRAAGVAMWAFSNGEKGMVMEVLENAGIAEFFAGVVSVEKVGMFKPAAEVYRHFLREAGCESADTWLISGNPFDVMGARAAGWHAAWVRRGAAVFDPWTEAEYRPSAIVASLEELPPHLTAGGG